MDEERDNYICVYTEDFPERCLQIIYQELESDTYKFGYIENKEEFLKNFILEVFDTDTNSIKHIIPYSFRFLDNNIYYIFTKEEFNKFKHDGMRQISKNLYIREFKNAQIAAVNK